MTLQISNRLKMIANELTAGSFFADVGSDHAYLPYYVCLSDEEAKAIAIEVREGPFKRALDTVNRYKLNDRIDVRLGDGLQAIQSNDQVEEIVIAGMGGTLISNILYQGRHKLNNVNKLIIQPNNNEAKVRETLIHLQFVLTNEIIIEENNLFYEILVAQHKSNTQIKDPYQLDQKQLLFGPYLLHKKSPTFIKKWQKEREKILETIKQMKQSEDESVQLKINLFKEKLKWIEEVIS